MKILGIETSCDETAISLIEVDEEKNTVKILGNTVHSQIDMHTPYGGVFPMLAKREHIKNIIPVLEKTLGNEITETDKETKINTGNLIEDEAMLMNFIPQIKKPDIDYISVTQGPGLEPALWVGINFAQALSKEWNVPLIPVNHMEGHILSAMIQKIHPGNGVDDLGTYDLLDRRILYPALSLLISGGHTQIVLIKNITSYEIVGETRDDAVGECFDKVARTLGLAYPGGPKVSKLAEEARAEGLMSPEPLPRPMIDSDNFDFSFSGLKTAVLYLVKKLSSNNQFNKTSDIPSLDQNTIKGICREVEDAITDVLISKMRKAIETYAVETIIIGGGVIANTHIRKALENLASDSSVKLLMPETDHSTDNGLMIALAGYFNKDFSIQPPQISKPSTLSIRAQGTLPLGPRSVVK